MQEPDYTADFMGRLRVDPNSSPTAEDILVCMRHNPAKPPSVPSTTGECAVCLHPIVFSTTAPTEPKKICWECTQDALGAMPADQRQKVVPVVNTQALMAALLAILADSSDA